MLILMNAALPAKKQTLHSGRNSIMCAGGGARTSGEELGNRGRVNEAKEERKMKQEERVELS